LEVAVERYQTVLLRYATRVLNNPDAAQDVVQEAFIRLHANWDQVVERGAPFKAWLFRTTHNAAVDYIRKETRRRLLHQRSEWQQLDASVPEDESRQSEQHAQILQHLNALKPKEREVLVLRVQEGMSYKEIAAVIQRSEGYVGTLIHSATKRLSQRLRTAEVDS
jgi:RNA polymerase sigma-70 factor (ECF subfamily)